ncbi:hypothetical protein [Methylobacterium sp. E-045]|uniref:hypothetical protein n=1 Tax=Methylobacterium sp. E-045 TaxID=2836575 RepID=UPI001FB943BE|nr:hypothetical protein [Methylobacterium sp. E-045]MCJ2131600.1 hypothetical protein [Methylobacterium sp. E-045]
MKRDHRGNPNKGPSHVRLYDWLMDSDAWKDLSAQARALYVLLKAQYRGMNNGRLVLSIRQVSEELHISKTTAAEAFKELVAHGFTEVVIRGSFGGRKDGRATEWRLTEHPCDVSGELPSKAFMRWRPGSISTVRPEGQSVPHSGLTGTHSGPSKSLRA